MSSQVVLVPLVPLAVVGIFVGVGMAGVGAANAVKSLVDKKVEAAREKIEAEKARLKEWETLQAVQKEQMEEMSRLQAGIRGAESELSAIGLLQTREVALGGGPTAEGYISLGKPKISSSKEIQRILENITSIMEGLPTEFREGKASPYQRLEKQRARLVTSFESKKLPALEELVSFKDSVSMSLQRYLKSLETTEHNKQGLFQILGGLLDDVLLCQELTSSPELISELDSLRSQVITLSASENIKPGHLEILQKKFSGIRKAVEYQNTFSAYRLSLAGSLIGNLADMGYEVLEPFKNLEEKGTAQAEVSIPGGERVRIGIQADNRLSFEMLHESDRQVDHLDEETLAFFRQQEESWCRDFQELIRRMTNEGFAYKIKLERNVPVDSIQVVVVETADEIIAAEQDEEEDMSRFRDELTARRKEFEP